MVAKTLTLSSFRHDVSSELERFVCYASTNILKFLPGDDSNQLNMTEIIEHIVTVKAVLGEPFQTFILEVLAIPALSNDAGQKLSSCLKSIPGYGEKYLHPITQALKDRTYLVHFGEYALWDKQTPIRRDAGNDSIEFTEFSVPFYYVKTLGLARPCVQVKVDPPPGKDWSVTIYLHQYKFCIAKEL